MLKQTKDWTTKIFDQNSISKGVTNLPIYKWKKDSMLKHISIKLNIFKLKLNQKQKIECLAHFAVLTNIKFISKALLTSNSKN